MAFSQFLKELFPVRRRLFFQLPEFVLRIFAMKFMGRSITFLVVEGTVGNGEAIAAEEDCFFGTKVTIKNLVVLFFLFLRVLLV